jgi:zona occludens toxin
MSIKLYCGIMGSGKSYEVVSEIIVNSLKQGRRVVSNIAGLNFEYIKTLLLEQGTPADCIGTLVQIDHEQVKDPLFWRTDTDDKTGRQPFIQKGDVLCLDENWRFWNGYNAKDDDGQRLPSEVKNFFRMHRQFPDPATGFTCEIALISQDPSDFSRFIKGVVEQIYIMTKLTALGMENNYRVDIYAKKITRQPLRSIQRTYDKKYFLCYKSHSQQVEGGAAAVERTIDDRGNMFKSAIFKWGIPLALLPVIPAGIFLYKHFHPADAAPVASVAVSSGSAVLPGTTSKNAQPEVSTAWRVVGHYTQGGAVNFIIENASGDVRHLVNPPRFQFLGMGSSVELPEGGFATSWTSFKQAGKGIL